MIKLTLLFFSLLILIFFPYSCSKILNPDELNYIQPLTVGSEWNYKDTGFWPDGSVKDLGVDFYYRLGIKRDTIITGNVWALLISLPECDDCGFGEFLSNRSNGLWWGFPLEGDNSTWLRLPYPSKSGVKAINPYNEWWVENIDTMIKVPAGTFRCYHYKTKEISGSQDLVHDYFYSPGVGLVRLNWYTHSYDNSIYLYLQRDLINYSIK
jgi:hypothetical protein